MTNPSEFWTTLREFREASIGDSNESSARLHQSLDAFRAMPRDEQLRFQMELDTVLSELTSLRTLIRSIIAMK